MRMKLLPHLATTAIALILSLGASTAFAQEKVGVASAVNPNATGTPPNLATRTLILGTDIVHNERVVTTEAGQAEIQFMDRSSFSVGPGSDLVIDDFVYNPNAGTGKLAASAAKGVFRFVGGALSKTPDGVTVKTPSATIGIRGGIALIGIDSNGATTATFLFGREMTVTSGGVTSHAYRPNSVITATSSNAPPSAPTLASASQIGATLQQLDGRAGATGGASEVPTNQRLEASAYPDANSRDIVASNNAAQDNDGNPSRAPETTPLPTPDTRDIRDPILENPFNELAHNSQDFLPAEGPQTPVSSMPLSGSAFYDGQAVGTVNFGQGNSNTNGSYQQTWDFSTRTGSVLIRGFGGIEQISGTVSAGPTTSNAFSGTIGAFSGETSASGPINGSFHTIDNQPASQVHGNFSLNGGFSAQGTFRANPGGG